MYALVSFLLDNISKVFCNTYVVLIAALGVLVIIAYRVWNALFISPLREIPGPLIPRMFAQHLEIATLSSQMAFLGLYGGQKYGDIYVCQPKSVVITDPADIRAILSTPSFVKSEYYRILRFTGLTSTICTTDRAEMSKKRRMIGPYFSTSYLNKMEPIVLEHGVHAVIQRWDKQLQGESHIRVNYCEVFALCTLNIISRLVYGQEVSALDPKLSNTHKWMAKSTTYISARALLRLLPKPIFKLVTMPWEHLYDRIAGHVQSSIDTRKRLLLQLAKDGKGAEKPADMLQALLDCEDPESKVHFSREQIHSESLLLLIGGIDPTAFTMTWTVHLLLLYPECYRKAVQEVRSAFPSNGVDDKPITYAEAKAKLLYLEACILESMRLAPVPSMMIPRVVPEGGTTIKGYYLPPGTTIFANMLGSHLSPDYWKEPHRFYPDRFLDPANSRASHNVFVFGYGNRICMGKHLAWMNMHTILANILRRYDFALPEDYTRRGPTVIDPKTGFPKLMDASYFISRKPKQDADCWVTVSKAK
ncbi:hypothetical protein H4R20_003316 [Coemansia guatemalensis]|uniref:Cytochrome P450 monooxygenase n=1 Tax=Coemansia guatemalensis TaxID=2761395 RepID=A0A9W8HTX8_9FUNG|nr:hypothetical protein H4R20_003316 [Coemansia guatemalensis]